MDLARRIGPDLMDGKPVGTLDRLKYLDELYGDKITTLYSTIDTIEDLLPITDLVIGAVLIPGAAAPKLVSSPVGAGAPAQSTATFVMLAPAMVPLPRVTAHS